MDYGQILREGIGAGQFGGSIESHGEHAMGFTLFPTGCSGDGSTRFTGAIVDLGSGAGLPALVLAMAWPETSWTLVERRSGRADLLKRAVHRLGVRDRVEVLAVDAAIVARSELRGRADWVTARAFGSPSETAEMAAPLLKAGGSLLTSEPRDAELDRRWPDSGLERVGLRLVSEWTTPAGRYVRLRRNEVDVPDLPRRGARKQPLFPPADAAGGTQ